MKRVLYYITDHGRGHATRSIAIIKELQKCNIDVIIRNSNLENFLKNSLQNTKILSGKTDIGPKIKPDGFSIDIKKSKKDIHFWIKDLKNTAEMENENISKIKPDLIISDISVMPFLTAKNNKINSIAISNFSWFDVLKFLDSLDLEILKNTYNFSDLAIQLPFGTSMSHFKNKIKVGVVARKPTRSIKNIRNKLKLKDHESLVSFATGESKVKINCDFKKDVKILCMDSKITGPNIIKLPKSIPSQDAISASNLVIGKCGYGLISECSTNGIPFYYLGDNNHLEQNAMMKEISKSKIGKRISLAELENINFNNEIIKNLPKVTNLPFDNQNVSNKINEFLYN
jgi:uncharacterized protein (TIGR00661 family)